MRNPQKSRRRDLDGDGPNQLYLDSHTTTPMHGPSPERPVSPTSNNNIPSVKLGRKRQSGDRYPSGKLKPAEKQPGTPPAKIRRAVDLALAGAADPMLATAVGWLRLHTILTDTQVAAAFAYAKQQGQYDSVMGMPRRSAASPAYGSGYGGDNGDEPTPEAIKTAKRRYEALRAILRDAGPKATGIMERTCIEDVHPTAWELTDFISTLNAVAKHLRITA